MQGTTRLTWMAWLALLCLALGWPCFADEVAAVPVLQGRVNDYAGVLGGNARALEAKLEARERATGNQVVVLTVQDLGGRDIESYANEVFRTWKLGRKGIDDGVLIVLAVKPRSARIEVGYGLEGTLTDLASSRILRDTMHPRFAAGDYAGGMDAGVDAVLNVLAAQDTASPRPQPAYAAADDRVPWWGYLVLLVFGGIFFLASASAGRILPLGLLAFPCFLLFVFWGWRGTLVGLPAMLAGVYALRRHWMLRHTPKAQQRTQGRFGRWPPRFLDVWLWPGFNGGKKGKAAKSPGSGGVVGFLLGIFLGGRKRGGGSGSSSDSDFFGGGGNSGGGGSSDKF